MKYQLDLQSPDMEHLRKMADNCLTAAMALHERYQRTNGKGSRAAIWAGDRVESARRILGTLDKAIRETAPEAADHPIANLMPMASIHPDDMPLVYGAPRNDPRVARRKASNIRRKAAR